MAIGPLAIPEAFSAAGKILIHRTDREFPWMSVFDTVRTWARRIKRDAITLWFAYRDPRTPLVVKLLCVFVVAYALSPIDLIPDFIPVFGFLDDALLLPGLIWLAMKLLPSEIVAESRVRAEAWVTDQARSQKATQALQ